MTISTRILEPGQMEPPAGEIRFFFLPGRDVLARRAARLRLLAKAHPIADYLTFLAALAEAQHNAWQQFPTPSLPDRHVQVLCREHGMPLLATHSWPRDPAWQRGLQMILQQMADADLPPAAGATVAGLLQASASRLEEMADLILAGELANISPQEMVFVAAGLQIYWMQMASALGEAAFGRLEQGGLCPVCGSHPNVGTIGPAGATQGLRYLSCSLCAAQWHMVRIKCSNCESTQDINFFTLEGSNGAVKAESCHNCDTYLKLLYLEKDPRMEAVADDLATLSLDMLMDQEGKTRRGPNLFFHPGIT